MSKTDESKQTPAAPRVDAYGVPITGPADIQIVRESGDSPNRVYGSDVVEGYHYGWSGGPTPAARARSEAEVLATGGRFLPEGKDVNFPMAPKGGPEHGRVYYRLPEDQRRLDRQRYEAEAAARGTPQNGRVVRAGHRPAPLSDDPAHYQHEQSIESGPVGQARPAEPPAPRGRRSWSVGADLT